MKIILYITFLLFSQETDPAKLYQQNNYSKALENYIIMIEKDSLNPYLHYNIANCYYKLGETQRALAYYIKAFIINPRIKNNISNLKKISKETDNELFSDEIPDILYRIYYLLSESEIITILHILLFTISIFILIWLINLKLFKKTLISLISLLIIFCVWYMLRKNSIFYNPAVTLKETDIYSGPNDSFTILATIPQSKVVMILNESDNFTEVGVPGQNIKGWIKNEKIINIKKGVKL